MARHVGFAGSINNAPEVFRERVFLSVSFVDSGTLACLWSSEFQARVADKLSPGERIALKAKILEAVQDTLNRQLSSILEA